MQVVGQVRIIQLFMSEDTGNKQDVEMKTASLPEEQPALPQPVMPEILSELMAQANILCANIQQHVWKEPLEEVRAYAIELQAKAEGISEALDQIDDIERLNVQKEMFLTLAQILTEKTRIHDPAFAEEIFAYFKACVTYLLPLRLHDSNFLKMVNEVILDNKKPLYKRACMEDQLGVKWNERQTTPVLYLNKISALESYQTEVEEFAAHVAKNNLYFEGEDVHWRDALKPGHYIDVKHDEKVTDPEQNEGSCIVKGWKRAKIVKMEEAEDDHEKAKKKNGQLTARKLIFHFLGDKTTSNYSCPNTWNIIAPVGMYTPGWDKKLQLLQPDSVFDVCDEQRNWFRATIIERMECEGNEAGKDCDGNTLEEVKVGYRYYTDDGETIPDPTGRHYIGYSPKFDIIRRISLASIQFAGSMVKPYTGVGEKMQTRNANDQKLNDSEETIFTNDRPERPLVYTVYRPECKIDSEKIDQYLEVSNNSFKHYTNLVAKNGQKFDRFVFMIDMLNNFGKRGGFHRIIELIGSFGEEQSTLDITNLVGLMQFVLKTCWHYHRQFANYFIQQLQLAFQKCVNSKNSPFLSKAMTHEHSEQLRESFTQILGRYMVPDLVDRAMIQSFWGAVIRSWLANKENLERRILATKYLSKQIMQTLEKKSDQGNADLMAVFQETKLFSLLYSRDNHHSQLVSRTQPVFDFHVRCKRIGNDELDMLWELVLMEEQAKHDIYALLINTKFYLDETLIDYFFQKFKTLHPTKVSLHDLNFLHKMADVNTKLLGPKEVATAALWQIATLQHQGYNKDIYEASRKHFIDLLKTLQDKQLEQYAIECCRTLGEADKIPSSVQVLLILHEVVLAYPVDQKQYMSNQEQYKRRAALLTELHEKHDLKKKLFQEIDSYTIMAQAEYDAKRLTEANYKTYEFAFDKFSHQQNLEVRINMLMFIQQSANIAYPIESEQLNQLYDALLRNPRLKYDAEMFYKWFNHILSDKKWISVGCVRDFFTQEFLTNAALVHSLDSSGFTCVSQMFLMINDLSNQIDIATDDEVKRQLCPDFIVYAQPSQLEGIEVIWQMYEHSSLDKSQQIIDFLAKIYYSTSPKKRLNESGEVYNLFINECFKRMKAQEDPNELVQLTMKMWAKFFTETERKGTVKMRSHATLDQDTYTIRNLILVPQTVQGPAKYLVFNVESNMTVFELIDIVAKYYDKSPLKVCLKRSVFNGQELSAYCFFVTLGQLGIQDNEELQIMSVFPKMAKKTPLTKVVRCDKVILTQKANAVFKAWFEEFSQPDTVFGRVMTRPDVVRFFEQTKKRQFEENEPIIENFFTQHDHDNDGKITAINFLLYYRDLCIKKPIEVGVHLKNNRIGEDLEPLYRSYPNYGNDELLTTDVTFLPRCRIANNMDQLTDLFNMGRDLDATTSQSIWNTISSMKTNTSLYTQILSNDQTLLTSLLNPNLLESIPIHQLLYYLQIIKFMVRRVLRGASQACEVAVYVEKEKEEENEVMGEEGRGEAFSREGGDQDDVQVVEGETKDQKIIREWKGQVRMEMIDHELFLPLERRAIETRAHELGAQDSNFDELHDRWLVDFLQKKGLEVLSNILNAFIVKQAGQLSFAEGKCLNLTAYMLKVLLVGCFSVTDAAGQLSTNLMRKMSSTNSGDNNEVDVRFSSNENKNKASERLYRAENINEMVKILEQEVGLTDDILENLNKEQLMTQIQNLLELVLSEKNPSQDTIGIVKECLNIWTSFVSYNPHLLSGLYATVDQQRSHFVQVLINQGLMGKNGDMRFEFVEALLFVSQNVKSSQLPEAPATFFLRVLLEQLVAVVTRIDPQNTKQYFQLLDQLIQSHFREVNFFTENQNDLFQEKKLLHQILAHLSDYKSHETKENSEKECDFTLVGLITIATALLEGAHQKKLEVFEGNQAQQITQLILNKLLFGEKNIEKSHLTEVTKAEDLEIFGKAAGYKCHNFKSREVAYRLFLFLVEKFLSEQEFDVTVCHYWNNLLMRVEKPMGKLYDPVSQKRAENGFAGLKNLGATCYMNSMLQQFYNMPILRYSIINASDKQPPNLVEHDGRVIDDNFLHQTQTMFTTLELTDRISYNTRDYCFSYKDGGQPVNVRIQQDVSEFLSKKIDRLEELLKNSRGDKYLCQNVFQGETCSLKVCGGCGNRTESIDPFYMQSIEIKHKASIQEGLENTTKGEIIADYHCDKCNQRVELTKKSVVKRLPNTLIIHLNRIIFDMERMTEIKLNDRCEFPSQLNMRPYMYEEVLKKDEEQRRLEQNAGEDQKMGDEKQEEKEAQTDTDDEYQYKLVGVLIHMGGAQAGHYISYINVDRDSEQIADAEQQRWYEFNDQTVKEFNFKNDVESHCFGGMVKMQRSAQNWNDEWDDEMKTEQDHNAYMLIYEKVVKVPFKIDLDPAHIDLIKSSESAENLTLPHCYTLYPGLIEQVRSGDTHFKNDEHYALVDQRVFNKTVQANKQVDTLFDNQKFLVEKQVFSSTFYETTTKLFEKVISNLEKRSQQGDDVSEQCSSTYKILDHLIFDLMANSKNPSWLVQLTDQMLRVAFTNRDTFQQMVEGRIFVAQDKLEKDEKNFFEVLIHHGEPEIRQMTSDILQHVFARSYIQTMTSDDEEHRVLCDRIADGVMDMMNADCEKALWKLGQYFDFFEKLMIEPADDAPDSSLRFISKDVRTSMVDYFKRRRILPRFLELVTKAAASVAPPFMKALKVILYLVKAQPVLLYDYDKDIECGDQQASPAEILAMVRADPSIVSPYFAGKIDKLDENCFLDPDSLQTLFMDGTKKSKRWLEILMKDDTYINDLATLVAHMCWKNLNFSRKAGKVILKGCNKHNWQSLVGPITCAQVYLTIEDEFQNNRIEWLLGFPEFKCKEQYAYQDVNMKDIKVGCRQIKKVEDQVYSYRSDLLTTFNEDSFLQNIYENKDMYHDSAMVMLLGLITACVEKDKNSILLKTLLTIAGPAYTCVRYWDWIESHCVAKMYYKYATQQQTNLYGKMLELINKLKIEKAHMFADIKDPATKQMLEKGGYPLTESYLVWDNLKHNFLDIKNKQEEKMDVGICELTTEVSPSVPTGSSNECLEEHSYKKQIHYQHCITQYEVRQVCTQQPEQDDMPVRDIDEPDYENKDLTDFDFIEREPKGIEVDGDESMFDENKDPQKDKRVDANNRAHAQSVLCLVIKNHAFDTTHVTIKWNQELRDHVNFKLPYNDQRVKIFRNTLKLIIAFAKLRIDDSWGSLLDPEAPLFTLHFRNPEEEKNQKLLRRQQHRAQNQEGPMPIMEEMTPIGKECSICTYVNPEHFMVCEVCSERL